MRSITGSILFCSALLFPLAGQAFPFKEDPRSFEAYLNTRSWKDGSTLKFSGLNTCRMGKDLGGNSYYGCTGGFVTITNPQGTKVCVISWPKDPTSYIGNYLLGVAYSNGRYQYNAKECRWR